MAIQECKLENNSSYVSIESKPKDGFLNIVDKRQYFQSFQDMRVKSVSLVEAMKFVC